MIYTDLTKKALKLCFEAHREQVDKSGMPYVFHPFHLAEQMDDEISTVCALLHDVVEDSDIGFDGIREMGFPQEVIDVLTLLTHDNAVPYMEYIKNLSKNSIAKKIKIADLQHNSDVSRLDKVDGYTTERLQKYQEALRILSK